MAGRFSLLVLLVLNFVLTGALAFLVWRTRPVSVPADPIVGETLPNESALVSQGKADVVVPKTPVDTAGASRESSILPGDPSPSNVAAMERTTIELFRRTSPSVVHITTSRVARDFFNLNVQQIPQGSGTGFVWDKEGHIVTNDHVIRQADVAMVAFDDQTTYPAKLIGVAEDKDLAVLKIDAPKEKLRPIPIGVSADLEVGRTALAIGNPFGLDQTLTTGIISALGREIQSESGIPIKDVIQTDAAINPGNSGGPLLDRTGHLIGVNTAIYSPSGAYAGIGFAIPVDTVRWVVPELIEHGRIIRPGIGMTIASDSMMQRFKLPKGVLVLDVPENGNAADAGLRPTRRTRFGEIVLGDIIVGVDEYSVESTSDLTLIFENYKAGDDVDLVVLRNGKETTLNITLETLDGP
ncbi:MAG: trypsin-like peptidase domain-containing protein [Pirellulaceae bacterium]